MSISASTDNLNNVLVEDGGLLKFALSIFWYIANDGSLQVHALLDG